MSYLKKIGAVALALMWLLPVKVSASGYSEYENHEIWQLRLAAARYAAHKSQKICGWAPQSPVVFSDQFLLTEDISSERLFLSVMAMLRLDQNARAISDALPHDEVAYIKAKDVDYDNLLTLRNIFSDDGFPTRKQVGDTGLNAMLMLVAHADSDLEFQKSVLIKMNDEVDKGILPAIYPVILKTIRPQTAGASILPKNDSLDADRKTYSSPRECYAHTDQNFINSYIRSRASISHLGVLTVKSERHSN